MTQAQVAGPADLWLDPEEQRAWRTMTSVLGRLLDRLDAELEANHGISLAEYEVLVHLSEASGQAMRMAELAVRQVVSPSGLTRRLDGLVRDGLVERRPCPSDRRGTLAVLTDTGRAKLEEAAPTHVTGVRRYVIGALEGGALRDMEARMRLIGASIDEAPPVDAIGSPQGPRLHR